MNLRFSKSIFTFIKGSRVVHISIRFVVLVEDRRGFMIEGLWRWVGTLKF